MLGDYVRGFPGNNGRWYLVDRPPTEVKVYDGAGAFLHRFGRSGEGPGEFSLIRYVLPIGEGVVAVLDDPSGLKFFDSAGNLLREARLPFAPGGNGAVYADGLGFVIAANAPIPGRAGLPLHIVDLDDGSVDVSFGSLTGEYPFSDVGGAEPLPGRRTGGCRMGGPAVRVPHRALDTGRPPTLSGARRFMVPAGDPIHPGPWVV